MNNLNHPFRPGIVFKIKDEIDIPYDNEKEITGYFRHQCGIQWKRLFALCPRLQIKKLFCTLKRFEIAPLVEKAKQMNTSYKDPGFFSYFILSCTNETMAKTALEALLKMDQIETAYLQGGMTSAPANPRTAVKKKSVFSNVVI